MQDPNQTNHKTKQPETGKKGDHSNDPNRNMADEQDRGNQPDKEQTWKNPSPEDMTGVQPGQDKASKGQQNQQRHGQTGEKQDHTGHGKAGESHGKTGEPQNKMGESHGKTGEPQNKAGESHGKTGEPQNKMSGSQDNAPGHQKKQDHQDHQDQHGKQKPGQS